MYVVLTKFVQLGCKLGEDGPYIYTYRDPSRFSIPMHIEYHYESKIILLKVKKSANKQTNKKIKNKTNNSLFHINNC